MLECTAFSSASINHVFLQFLVTAPSLKKNSIEWKVLRIAILIYIWMEQRHEGKRDLYKINEMVDNCSRLLSVYLLPYQLQNSQIICSWSIIIWKWKRRRNFHRIIACLFVHHCHLCYFWQIVSSLPWFNWWLLPSLIWPKSILNQINVYFRCDATPSFVFVICNFKKNVTIRFNPYDIRKTKSQRKPFWLRFSVRSCYRRHSSSRILKEEGESPQSLPDGWQIDI